MMQILKLGFVVFVTIALILALGCKKEQTFNTEISENDYFQFKSDKYGFSFSFPKGWEEVNRDLPDRWALLDKDKTTILFIVNKPQSKDLLASGRSQAVKDLYNDDKISDLKETDLKKVIEIVKLESFNNKTWYTYGIKFADKNVDSLVSGTLCEDNEVMFVLVSDYLSFDKNKDLYIKMLNTFEC